MVNILISSEVENKLKETLPNCKSDLNIISGFCKLSTLQFIDSLINNDIKKRLLVRFLPSDLSSGATDKEIYSYCINHGWKIYVDFTIHAKTYIFDKIKCILGSANTTNKGLGISDNSNKEASTYFELDNDSYNKIMTLYKDSIELNDDLYSFIVNNCDDSIVIKHKKTIQLDSKIECLMPEDFPDATTDIVELYNLKSFKWLVSFLKEKSDRKSYYGEIASNIHNIFVKDPRPFRKDIKAHLSDLLECITRLDVKNISITRPNYSECVSLNTND